MQEWVLISAIAANLAALVYYKYAAWLIGLADASGLLSYFGDSGQHLTKAGVPSLYQAAARLSY